MNEKIRAILSKCHSLNHSLTTEEYQEIEKNGIQEKEKRPINAFLLSLHLDEQFYYTAIGYYGHCFSKGRGTPFKLESLEDVIYSLPSVILELVSIEFIHWHSHREPLLEKSKLAFEYA